MLFTRARLQVEHLESREVLDAGPAAPVMPVPPPTVVTAPAIVAPTTVSPIDTTAAPANSGSTIVQAQVTALGPMIGSSLSSITVTGLSAANVTSLSQLGIIYGGNAHAVTQVTNAGNGQYTLTVSGGMNPNGIQVGSTVTVVVGNGGNQTPATTPSTTTPTPTEPLSTVTPIDPTGLPAGS